MDDPVRTVRRGGPNAKIIAAALVILVVAVVAVTSWGLVESEDIGPSPTAESGAGAPPQPEGTGSVTPAAPAAP